MNWQRIARRQLAHFSIMLPAHANDGSRIRHNQRDLKSAAEVFRATIRTSTNSTAVPLRHKKKKRLTIAGFFRATEMEGIQPRQTVLELCRGRGSLPARFGFGFSSPF
jgi:hypothetical protein